jgi:hypothetical protein
MDHISIKTPHPKCRLFLKLTNKGTWRQVLICLRSLLFQSCTWYTEELLNVKHFYQYFLKIMSIDYDPEGGGAHVLLVERLYCKRPIQCLSSSKILTPHPLTARRVCTRPPLVRGEDTLNGWRGGGGSIFCKTPDTALYSTYVSTLWFY